MKILHIGNIAMNAYNNAKFLRNRGVEADVLIYDYYHVMGHPEWEDAYFTEKVPELYPDWSSVKILNKFKRPEWFIEINHSVTPPKFEKNTSPRARSVIYHTLKKILIKRALIPKKLRNIFGHYIQLFKSALEVLILKIKIENDYSKIISKKQRLHPSYLEGISFSRNPIKRFFQDWAYLYGYWLLAKEFKPIFEKYDIIQAYGLDPILVYLSGIDKPLVSFEHGTMRRLPLEDFIVGKILTLAYRKSKKCLITNLDCIETAKKIGLTNYEFIQHPVDTDKFSPKQVSLRKELLKKYNADKIFFAPARHVWKEKGNDRIINGFADFLKKSNKKAILIFSSWGADQDKSKNLINELGIKKSVIWTTPMPKMRLAEFFNASDIILDQFVEYGVFGTIVIEAMSCAKPVMMHFSKEKTDWALEESPTVVNAFSREEISKALLFLSDNPSEAEKIGAEARKWVEKYHSSDLVVDKLIKIYNDISKK